MGMMPLADLDHSPPDFHDLNWNWNWCTSASSSAAHEWINQSLMNYNNIINDNSTSNCNERWRSGGLFFNPNPNGNPKEIKPINYNIISSNHVVEVPNPNPIPYPMAQDEDLVLPSSVKEGIISQEKETQLLRSRWKPRIHSYGAIREQYSCLQTMVDEKLLARALQNMSSHHLLLPSFHSPTDFDIPSNESSLNGAAYANANFPSSGNSVDYNMLLLPNFDALAASRALNAMPFVREDAAFGPTSTTSTTALMQQLVQGRCAIQPKVPSLLNGVTAKRANNCLLESKTSQSHQDIPRKSQLEPRSPPFSSFKVRKEKLGDRIAALQQLVAPFGKTDTASVLMEAIGYIKFLQDQVETLSVPYLRLHKSKKQRTTQGEASNETEKASEEEAKGDLRSRGLCLVPLSCTSYVTADVTNSTFPFPGTI